MASIRPSTSALPATVPSLFLSKTKRAAPAPAAVTNHSTNHSNTASLSELPEELILEILVRLPVKSLLRFRCVCKSWEWDAFFRDPRFLKQHANASNSAAKLKILMTRIGSSLKSLPIPTLYRDKSWAKAQNLSLPLRVPSHYVKIVGSCNGMICLRVSVQETADDEIYFWNPSTNESMKMPYTFFGEFNNVFGFGFDDSTNEFKLVRLFAKYYSTQWDGVEVYGMWEGCRRRISDFPYGRRYVTLSQGVFLNGAIHWTAAQVPDKHGNWVIVSLDLAKETLLQPLPLPEQCCGGVTAEISCVGESLCVMSVHYDCHYDVWIIKDYGAKESWVKLLVTIPFVKPPLPSFPYRERRLFQPISSPIFFSPAINGDLLMLFHGKLVLYSSTEDSFRNIDEIEIGRTFTLLDNPICITYAESLFTPSLMMRLRGESDPNISLRVTSLDEDTGVITWSKT